MIETTAVKKLNVVVAFVLLFGFSISGLTQVRPGPHPPPPLVADLLVVGATVVTMDNNRRVIENGAVAIRGDKIEAVGTKAELTKQFRGARIIDATGKAIIPGLINTHTHVPMSLFRGISDDLELNDWLTKYIFPAEAKNVDEAFVRAGTRLGLAEMIRGGTTTYCDMY